MIKVGNPWHDPNTGKFTFGPMAKDFLSKQGTKEAENHFGKSVEDIPENELREWIEENKDLKSDFSEFVKKRKSDPEKKADIKERRKNGFGTMDIKQANLAAKVFFESGNGRVKRGNWSIAKGGYDQEFEVYYKEEPAFDCVDGTVEPTQEKYRALAKQFAGKNGLKYGPHERAMSDDPKFLVKEFTDEEGHISDDLTDDECSHFLNTVRFKDLPSDIQDKEIDWYYEGKVHDEAAEKEADDLWGRIIDENWTLSDVDDEWGLRIL